MLVPMIEHTEPDPVPFGDLVAPGLRALIVAINPSSQSVGIGHSFSSPSNAFWRLLHESGLTPMRLQPSEEHRLLDPGLGLVSTVWRATPSAAALSLAERRAGAARVRGLVERYEPQLVALLGLTLYPLYAPTGTSRGPGSNRNVSAALMSTCCPTPAAATGRTPGSTPSSCGIETSPNTSHPRQRPKCHDRNASTPVPRSGKCSALLGPQSVTIRGGVTVITRADIERSRR
jgi:G:T/U-mismatch repair DNA glycosylase